MMAVTTEALSGTYVSSGQVNGYLCLPKRTTEAGMLLLPHVNGIQAETRAEAAEFASLGYATLVWDPYPGVNAEETEREQLPQLDDNVTCKEQSACLEYLLREHGVKRVGAIGWCMGGRMGLVFAAREPRLNACVAYYPSMREQRKPGEVDAALEAPNIQCPVQIMWGTHDHVTSVPTFERYRNALDGCKQPTSVNVFPGADHGFLGRKDSTDANRIAAQLSMPQTFAFLRACLSPAGAE